MMNNKINLDNTRFLMAFLVIAIHTSPFLDFNETFDFFFTRILGRIAVPFFLMISGYYLLGGGKEKIKAYTWKIVKIYIFCMILYLPLNIYMGEFNAIHPILIIKDVFFNGTLYHLWYFPSLILGLWITYYLLKKMGSVQTSLIVALLYIIGLFGDSYYGLIEGIYPINKVFDLLFQIFDYTRNGFFFVPIFLYLGYMVRNQKRVNDHSFIFMCIAFLGMVTEGMLLHHFQLQRHDSMYLFLVPLMYFLFCSVVEVSRTENKNLRKIATSIYIFHPWFIVIIRFISGIVGLDNILVENHFIFYILVSLMTSVFAVSLEGLIKKINRTIW